MMAQRSLSARVIAQIDDAVQTYIERRTDYVNLADRVVEHLVTNHAFMQLIHSVKTRDKDPEHLRDKLERRARESRAKRKPFAINQRNVFTKIEDLAGVRLLHLRSKQIREIHPLLLEVLEKYEYRVLGTPEASSWDIETTELFTGLGFKIKRRPTLYTSVHYVVQPHYSKDKCEIQVRTLAEELWGEVSHALNYPHKTGSVACREQLLALARLTSGCTRLVDSIFASRTEHEELTNADANEE